MIYSSLFSLPAEERMYWSKIGAVGLSAMNRAVSKDISVKREGA